jgi:hypothetical protein
MPRYFLHICNGSGFTEDEEGREFTGVNEARQAAIEGIREVMAEELRNGEINIASYIEIENEHRQLVRTVAFTEAVAVKSDPCPRERSYPSTAPTSGELSG